MIRPGEVISPVTDPLPLRNGGCWLQGFDPTEHTCVTVFVNDVLNSSLLILVAYFRLRGDSPPILLFRINREALAIDDNSNYLFIARASQNLGGRVLKDQAHHGIHQTHPSPSFELSFTHVFWSFTPRTSLCSTFPSCWNRIWLRLRRVRPLHVSLLRQRRGNNGFVLTKSVSPCIGTTGGGSAAAATPTSSAQLASWLGDSTARVIVLDKTYDFTGSAVTA